MIRIIILNGLGGSGKSTFSTYCKEYLEENYSHIKVYELSTVDIVKKAAKAVGWSGGKTQSDRIFLSDLKFCMDKWKNLPIQSVFDDISNIVSNDGKENDFIFFVNSREQRDHNKIINKAKENNYFIKKLIVKNSNIVTTEVPELIEDVLSETYDYTIINDGTLEQLYQTVKDFCDKNLINS